MVDEVQQRTVEVVLGSVGVTTLDLLTSQTFFWTFGPPAKASLYAPRRSAGEADAATRWDQVFRPRAGGLHANVTRA